MIASRIIAIVAAFGNENQGAILGRIPAVSKKKNAGRESILAPIASSITERVGV
jgi:hypothetical protein